MWQTTPQSQRRDIGSQQGGILTTPRAVPPVAWGVVAAHCLEKQLLPGRHGGLGTGGVVSRQVCVQPLTRSVAASRVAPQGGRGSDPAARTTHRHRHRCDAAAHMVPAREPNINFRRRRGWGWYRAVVGARGQVAAGYPFPSAHRRRSPATAAVPSAAYVPTSCLEGSESQARRLEPPTPDQRRGLLGWRRNASSRTDSFLERRGQERSRPGGRSKRLVVGSAS